MYQPIEHQDKILYLSIETDIGVNIQLTDIYTFAIGFYAESENEFFNKTFQLNNLSRSDTDSTNEIIQNIKQIQSNLCPTFQKKLCQFSNDSTNLTLLNNPFKYTIPLSKLAPDDELKLIKSLYSELSQFSNLQNTLITSLENQILNKNKIISNLADAYVQRCTYEKVNNTLESKFISDLFVNRNLLDFAQSTVSECIEKLQPTSNTSIMHSKNNPLWTMIVHPHVTTTRQPSITKTTIQSSTKITKKRKLQGLLRREQRKKNL